MHELSIAQHVIELACEAAQAASGTKVTSLRLKIGVMSGVAADALRFSFDVAAAGTLCEGAQLTVEEVHIGVCCLDCDQSRTLVGVLRLTCPVCGSPSLQILQGKELELASIEVEFDEPTRA